MHQEAPIKSRDYWVKEVEMLQQNWALIEPDGPSSVRVHFISDTGGIFDTMAFPSNEKAIEALSRNGFRRYAKAADLHSFLRPPDPPFHQGSHPNGRIYSSGRFWKD